MKNQPVLIRALHLSEYILFSTYGVPLKLINPTSLFANQFKTAMKKYFLFLFITFIIQACQDENPIAPDNNFTLTALETSCTEVWLQIKIQNIEMPVTAVIYEQDSIIEQLNNLNVSDTIIYIDSLKSRQSYKYKYVLTVAGRNYSSNTVTVNTMDTTSHNFTWYTWTYSGDATCAMYDAFMYDEDNIFTVGYLTRVDPSGTFQHYYPILKWNGIDWDLIEIFTPNLVITKLSGIWVFNPSHIYLAGSRIYKWDGSSSTAPVVYETPWQTDPEASIYDLWGNSDSLIYGIGTAGYLVTKGKYSWEKIETGTRDRICRISGAVDNSTGKLNIYCTVSELAYLGRNSIIKVTDRNKIQSVPWNSKLISPIWTPNGWLLYAGGEGLYSNKSGEWIPEFQYEPIISSIKGNGLNDIFITLNNGYIGHYNGFNWRVYPRFSNLMNYNIFSISVKGNMVIGVGRNNEDALIVMGIRH